MLDGKNAIPIYHTFGLKIQCELASAKLFGMIHTISGVPDAIIRIGDVPSQLENPEYHDTFVSVASGCVLLKIEGVARYLICNGKEIIIQPEPGAKEGDIATFAFGSALGTLLYQRHILAVHGSAIRTSKGGVIFSGNKGAGKSTTAAALSFRGWEFMSDDVCAVHIKNNKPVLYPGLSRAKLALDSYSWVQNHTPVEPPVSPFMNKYGISLETTVKASPLYAVCVLEPTYGSPYVEKISGTERLSLLTNNIYRPLMHQLIEHPIERFKHYLSVTTQALVFRAFRPLDYCKTDEFLQLLEEKILT